MTPQTSMLSGLLAFVLLATSGCDGSTTGTTGAGGSRGPSGIVPEGAQLVYEGDPLILIGSANVCNVVTDGSRSTISAGIQTGPDVPNQAMLAFLKDEDDAFMGRDVFDSLATGQGNVADVSMFVGGSFDLLDFADDVLQIIGEVGTCSVDFSFVETVELFPGTNGDKYAVDFECPTVPYTLINTMTSESEGSGNLTDLSGQFECIMTAFEE